MKLDSTLGTSLVKFTTGIEKFLVSLKPYTEKPSAVYAVLLISILHFSWDMMQDMKMSRVVILHLIEIHYAFMTKMVA